MDEIVKDIEKTEDAPVAKPKEEAEKKMVYFTRQKNGLLKRTTKAPEGDK